MAALARSLIIRDVMPVDCQVTVTLDSLVHTAAEQCVIDFVSRVADCPALDCELCYTLSCVTPLHQAVLHPELCHTVTPSCVTPLHQAVLHPELCHTVTPSCVTPLHRHAGFLSLSLSLPSATQKHVCH